MLYFITKSRDYTWQVGSRVPIIAETITSVQADGAELEWVENKSNGTVSPSCGMRVMTWHEIEARMIYRLMCKGM